MFVMTTNGTVPQRRRSSVAHVFAILALLGVTSCKGDSDSTPVSVEPPGPNPSRQLGFDDPLPGIVLAVTEVTGNRSSDGSFASGDTMTVRYTARTTNGDPLDVRALDGGAICVSGPTFNYQRVIAQQTDLRSASVYEGDGVWSYRFGTPIPQTYLAPINDTSSFTDGELTGQALLAGTYTVGLRFDATYSDVNGRDYVDAGSAVGDFVVGGVGTATARAVVQDDNCNVCHTDLRMHGGRIKSVRMCVLCHTAGAEDSNVGNATPGVTIEFKVLIHKLHNAAHLPSVLGVSTDASGERLYPGMVGAVAPQPLEFADDEGEVEDFSEVHFPVWPNLNIAMPKDENYSTLSSTDPDGSGPLVSPRSANDTIRQGVTACVKCHGDPDADGPLTAPAQGNVSLAQPNRRACGSCHDDVDFTKPYNGNGLSMDPQADDSSCAECHATTAANQSTPALKPLSITEAHLHPLLDATIDAGVNSVVTGVTGGSGAGGSFQNGDTPTVLFTLQNDAQQGLSLAAMDSCSAFFMGPTTNRQLIMPLSSANGMALNPYDFAGRLAAASTTGKGSMSKVVFTGNVVAETLVVEFTSATQFSITGSTSGALGSATLPASTSTNQPGSANPTISAIELAASATAGSYTIVFGDATNFTVNGPSGPIDSGFLPADRNSSTRFTSSVLSFNVSQGGSPMTSFPHTVNMVVASVTGAANLKFLVMAGRTAFSATAGARDRFYYDIVPDASTYSLTMPMDLLLEFLGDATGAANEQATAGNLPVLFGRQTLWQAATTATTTTTTATVARFGRSVTVTSSSGWANGDTVAVEPAAGVGVREYVQIAPERADGVIAASGDTTTKINFKTPLRYDHGAGATITKVTLTVKQEGAANAYTLDPVLGRVTATSTFTAGNALVMSYRSNARFGFLRHNGDSLQAVYVPPANDSADIGQEQGDWQGLPFADGTYTVDVWFYKNIDLGLQNEVQTYRSTSNAGTADFLFGTATQIVPRAIISTSANCYTCHNDVIFHGGGRRGVDACLTCHAVSGNEDKPRWDTPKVGSSSVDTALTTGVAIEFRQMLHKVHRGSGLANAATYTVVGNGGNPSTFGDIEFPAMPGGVRQCVRCHGNDAWKEPAAREHPSATLSVKKWTVVCGACHDGDGAQAHIGVNTSSGGEESCEVCHGSNRQFAVERMHRPR